MKYWHVMLGFCILSIVTLVACFMGYVPFAHPLVIMIFTIQLTLTIGSFLR